ncbi:ABC-three component system middle component 6 [Mycoplasma yeatsii]|uniref:ABC-three component system middle component 6 n=1 Tax=Mycoplasma yeatsii TaxID=51365 RepID=UPI000566F45F|nr:ABC-three component system middle component 6 [Mycoplasma yeatsii]
MLLPDNINPKLCIYYNASIILEILEKNEKSDIVSLYENVNKQNDTPFPVFLLSLDWLYLIDAININEKGVVLCL